MQQLKVIQYYCLISDLCVVLAGSASHKPTEPKEGKMGMVHMKQLWLSAVSSLIFHLSHRVPFRKCIQTVTAGNQQPNCCLLNDTVHKVRLGLCWTSVLWNTNTLRDNTTLKFLHQKSSFWLFYAFNQSEWGHLIHLQQDHHNACTDTEMSAGDISTLFTKC